uniref:TNFR-Cys domain-containing protein n=1 Tax=Ornithorhynchus anatinus TaxID=9258 RepID=A0A6I8NXR0_ORNAN
MRFQIWGCWAGVTDLGLRIPKDLSTLEPPPHFCPLRLSHPPGVSDTQRPGSGMVCQENQFQDERGQCVDCGQCGPGWELSKECGYGEGGPSPCTACPRRRFKATRGHHSCRACTSCALFNRVQTSGCTGTADAVCGHCLPGFYSKTRIGGRQDRECFPCTQRTPPSEDQCGCPPRPSPAPRPPGPPGRPADPATPVPPPQVPSGRTRGSRSAPRRRGGKPCWSPW